MRRLKRKMDKNEKGVATTVGTIMALLIFLSILSLITQQYVPVWMEDNESYHMDEVKGQFADIKGGVDSLVINDMTDYPRYSSVNLGTEGVPMFSGASPGRLSFNPRWSDSNPNKGMYLNFTDTESNEWVTFRSSGNLSYHAINREFEDQTLVYEHGALILEQSDGEIMRARPHISVEEVETGEYEVSITLYHLIGDSRELYGTSQVGVTTELVSIFSNTYSNVTNLNWNLTTAYPELWQGYIGNEIDALNLSTSGNTVGIFNSVDNITELEIRRVRVEMELQR
ncbi:MAG: hypothetical protein ACLFSM_01520 [Thermoplasmata archaeon]